MFPFTQSRIIIKQFLNVIICLLSMVSLGFAGDKIATVYHFTGNGVVIRNDEVNPIDIIVGRSIFEGDKIQTYENSSIHISYDDKNTSIILDESSEFKLSETSLTRSIHVHHGSFLLQNSSGNIKKMYIFSESSQIFCKEANMWYSTNLLGDDECHILDGKAIVFNETANKKITANQNNIIYSFHDGTLELLNENNEDLPKYILDKKYTPHLNKQVLDDLIVEDLPISKYDLIPIYGEKYDPFQYVNNGIGLSLTMGGMLLSNYNYSKVNIKPRYHSKYIRIALNIDGYLTHENYIDLNEFADVYDVIDRIDYLNYTSANKTIFAHIGKLQPITFGYGQLIHNYSNQINSPFDRNTGLYIRYYHPNNMFSLEAFTASLKEIQKGGGVSGLRATTFISYRFPLTLGIGIVSDLNQFSGLPESSVSWSTSESVNHLKRNLTAIECDLTYKWISSPLMDVSFFAEAVGIWLPENHYYAQLEPDHTDDNKWREGTWGITLPGIWVNYKNYYDYKIALQINSALHLPQYFSANYELERIRYANAYDDNIVSDNQGELLSNYAVNDAYYLLPKDIYPIIELNENDITETGENNFPTIGIWTDWNYHFRKIIDVNIGFSFFKEMTSSERSDEYYSTDFNIALQDKVLKGISQFSAFASQVYSSTLFDFSNYDESILLGAKIGFSLPYNLELILEHRELQYDSNFDGSIDKMNISLAELQMVF